MRVVHFSLLQFDPAPAKSLRRSATTRTGHASRIEHVDEAVIRYSCLLFWVAGFASVCDVEPPAEVLNIEGGVAVGNVRIAERSIELHGLEGFVVHVNRVVLEIGGVEVVGTTRLADREAVYTASAVAPIYALVDGGGGGTPEFQPLITPVCDGKMNRAGPSTRRSARRNRPCR